ncbi:helix-turn-helix domain-containing protein [Clostridium oryzae]|uniref:Tetratricopeptide repeat protein n=1 Tax=Clostridium oryzae TaxID=1450648 RepID=A0A1V4IJ32_9CLOT|nr:helix-turn-helix transcriptional regulator [Clostridium oryzae]OPJ59933.1 tetratricopeptide repeat protein [Clostridium oryzae]
MSCAIMNDAQILSPGEKLKYIRKRFKFTQDEVAGGSITRNLISLIESNKAALTPQVAAIVTENINKLCKNNEIFFSISETYLLESIEEQVNKKAQEYIDYLSDTNLTLSDKFQDKINAVETFLAKYDLAHIKLEIYFLIAEIYDKCNEFSYAYKYYIKAFENSGKLSVHNTKQIDLLFSLAHCCDVLGKYKECLDYYTMLETHSTNLDSKSSCKLNFNKMMIHKKLNQFDNCLKEIEYLEKNFSLESNYNFAIMNTKANCYKNKKLYTKAIDTYNQLLAITNNDNIEYRLIVLCNMIETYIILHDTMNLKLCLKSSNDLLNIYSSIDKQSFSQQIYNDLGLGALEIKDYERAKNFFLKSVEESRLYKNSRALTESFENLIDVCVLLKDRNSLNDLKNKLLESISLDIIPRNSMLILKLIQYYNYIGDSENIQNILNFIL